MNETDKALLNDMRDAANKIRSFVKGKTRTDLEKDDGLIGFALAKAIEVIGEAANHVSEETRLSYAAIEWGDIIGMRNRLIHAYGSINYDIVWDTATVGVPKLISDLEMILSESL